MLVGAFNQEKVVVGAFSVIVKTECESSAALTEPRVPGWLSPLCTAVSLVLAPASVSLCRHKSTRLTAVTGGLVTGLSCLFSSFATQFHQLIISLGLIQGDQREQYFNNLII